MGTSPIWVATKCMFTALVDTANTSRDGSGTLETPTWTGTTSGPPETDWQLNRLVLCQATDLADSVMTMFTYDGTNTRLCWEYDFGDPAAASTTVTGLITEIPFCGWGFPADTDLRFGITVAPTAGVLVVHGFCERA
jgi:hypothetical protein